MALINAVTIPTYFKIVGQNITKVAGYPNAEYNVMPISGWNANEAETPQGQPTDVTIAGQVNFVGPLNQSASAWLTNLTPQAIRTLTNA